AISHEFTPGKNSRNFVPLGQRYNELPMGRGVAVRGTDQTSVRFACKRCNDALHFGQVMNRSRNCLDSNVTAAVSIERTNKEKYGGVVGLKTMVTRRMDGTISLSSSIHFPPIENSKAVNPVALVPGLSRLAT